jgi:hypothetical protein
LELTGENIGLWCSFGLADYGDQTWSAFCTWVSYRTSDNLNPPGTTIVPATLRFCAAFLTFVFAGVGHVYADAYKRALVFSALPLMVFAEFAGQFIRLGARDFAL